MANQGHNEGIRVLEDFVCEAIRDPAVPQGASPGQGRNEGMRLVEEVVIDLGGPDKTPDKEEDAASQTTGEEMGV